METPDVIMTALCIWLIIWMIFSVYPRERVLEVLENAPNKWLNGDERQEKAAKLTTRFQIKRAMKYHLERGSIKSKRPILYSSVHQIPYEELLNNEFAKNF
ncbi:MAG: hypothetical protein COX80_01010 [Candidatus Magasanikbacteria bacterium CG_4_10_14_0_2_um_filter_33_14]|uniref:Uncharacterized protein n=1 Tax=Candidatus Magasanikbacteria bacterium CG_4_10_14_0_2_um_filter_33_14 TaxID=1974636 RepID=A0A2M7VBP0_9BACT|nr:MAG: hypothetical protein COX80_01010 [Candidatus Magasanikbacteria bacterium CG_4_10_14_0_2_um_filter_33_14]